MILHAIAHMKYAVLKKESFQTDIAWPEYLGQSVRKYSPLDGRLEYEAWFTGVIDVYPGFLFDGASGPTDDDETNVGPALIHDIHYDIIRDYGGKYFTREEADRELARAAIYNCEIKYLSRKAALREAELVALSQVAPVRAAWIKSKYAAKNLANKTWFGTMQLRYRVWLFGLRKFGAGAARYKARSGRYETMEVM